MRFDEVLEVVEQLPPDEQEALIDLLQRRSLAQRRAALAKDVKEAREERQAGGCQPRASSQNRSLAVDTFSTRTIGLQRRKHRSQGVLRQERQPLSGSQLSTCAATTPQAVSAPR